MSWGDKKKKWAHGRGRKSKYTKTEQKQRRLAYQRDYYAKRKAMGLVKRKKKKAV